MPGTAPTQSNVRVEGVPLYSKLTVTVFYTVTAAPAQVNDV